MSDGDAVYDRVMRDLTGEPSMVCLQWFDEFGYDPSRYLTRRTFVSEDDAWTWLALMRAGEYRLAERLGLVSEEDV